MEYFQVLENLKNSLNGKLSKQSSDTFLESIKILKNEFGQTISTKFLKGLMNNCSNRFKSKRINYLLNKSGLQTKKGFRFCFKEWVLNKYSCDVVNYGINKDNKVFVKNIKRVDVGKLSLNNKSECLHFIPI